MSHIDELQAEVGELRAKLAAATQPRDADDRNALAEAYHRADSVYQLHGEATPQPMPGEGPLAFRIRLAAGLRKHSQRFAGYAIRDSLDPRAFDLVEKAIYAEAEQAARNPSGPLREVKTTEHGKTISNFYGDSRAAWAPFMPPVQTFITGWNRTPYGSRAYKDRMAKLSEKYAEWAK